MSSLYFLKLGEKGEKMIFVTNIILVNFLDKEANYG